MRLGFRFSLVLIGSVLFACVITTAAISHFFASDQESYVSDFQSTTALQIEEQLLGKGELLYSKIGALLPSSPAVRSLSQILTSIPGAVGIEWWRQNRRIASLSPASGGSWTPPEGPSRWTLAESPRSPLVRWIGRYESGCLVIDLTPWWFGDWVKSSHGETVRLLDGDGKALLSSATPLPFESPETFTKIRRQPPGNTVTLRYADRHGDRILGSFLRLPSEPPVVIAVTTPRKAVTAAILRIYWLSGVIATSCIGLAVLIGVVFANGLINPLQFLAEQMAEMGHGHFTMKPAERFTRRTDEIGALARAFYGMGEELEKVRSELARKERLVAFGQSSSAIAHEIKNPLTGILANVQIVREWLKEPGKLDARESDELLGLAVEEANRAHSIVNKLMKFARQDRPPTATIDLKERVEHSLALLRPSLQQQDVTIESRLPDSALYCVASSDQIHEVLANLVQNSIHAMESAKERKLRIELREDRGNAVLRVADSGKGMAPEEQKRIFEPFFTTKGIGKGTGLGLAVVYGIVHSHRGEIAVESAPGEGAVFTITLPLAPASDSSSSLTDRS